MCWNLFLKLSYLGPQEILSYDVIQVVLENVIIISLFITDIAMP